MQFATAVRNARLDQIETTIGTAPKLRIFSGSAPGVANAATGTLLSTITLPTDWLASATGGTKSLAGTWQDSSAAASGTPGYFRILDSTGTTSYLEGSAGVGSGELNFSTTISLGGVVSVTSFVITDGNP